MVGDLVGMSQMLRKILGCFSFKWPLNFLFNHELVSLTWRSCEEYKDLFTFSFSGPKLTFLKLNLITLIFKSTTSVFIFFFHTTKTVIFYWCFFLSIFALLMKHCYNCQSDDLIFGFYFSSSNLWAWVVDCEVNSISWKMWHLSPLAAYP